MDFNWIDGSTIKVRTEDDAVVISANRAGLLSLADHLTALAGTGGHFHLDEYNALEDGSAELIVEMD